MIWSEEIGQRKTILDDRKLIIILLATKKWV